MTNNTQAMRSEDSVLSAFEAPGHGVSEQSFRDLGLDLSPLAMEKALVRAHEIADSGAELTDMRLRDIATEATSSLEVLDDVVAAFR